MTSSVTIRHNFETGHRLPHLNDKCQNLHGHSWQVSAQVSAPSTADGVVIEFGLLKREVRAWIDAYLDHGIMLGADDPLVPVLSNFGKLFIFDPHPPARDGITVGLQWPTVENVAVMLARQISRIVSGIQRAPDAQVIRVDVQETATNIASWEVDYAWVSQ